MIFGGTEAYGDKSRLKVARHEVHAVEPVVPQYLQWSEFPIGFDRRDHLDRIPHLETYPSSLSHLWARSAYPRCSWTGGSGLSIMYVEIFDDLGIACSTLRPSSMPFHGIIFGHQAYPLGQITLPVIFGDHSNFHT